MRPVALLLLLAACEREWVREYDGSVLSNARPGAVFLVRDHLTGRPIRGALVRQHVENEIGPDGRWAASIGEGFTDEFGLVTFPLREGLPDFHWAVQAQGYAPTESYGTGIADEIELRPGRTFRGRVLGIDGEPVADALVEWKVGCAHAPSLASARTDATGLFLLDGIDDGEFVLEGPPGAADYLDAASGPWPAPVNQVLPGRTIEGRVRRMDGTAPAWAVVSSSTRAPRALASRDGRFSLGGFERGPLWVWWDGGFEEIQDDFAPGLPAALAVGGRREASDIAVRVRPRDATGAPPVALAIHFDGLDDGRRRSFEWSPWGDPRRRGAAWPTVPRRVLGDRRGRRAAEAMAARRVASAVRPGRVRAVVDEALGHAAL